jgi:hypothetical protein
MDISLKRCTLHCTRVEEAGVTSSVIKKALVMESLRSYLYLHLDSYLHLYV